MSQCDHRTSQRLLAGDLSPAEEAAAVRHLDACPQCQALLEQQAGADDDWSTTRRLLGYSAELARWPRRAADAATITHDARLRESDLRAAEIPHPAVDISFLAPTDDPAYLGRVGPYEVAGVIGHGGTGVVLKAVDRSLSRFVAIKVLSPALAGVGAARQRFAREARAMAALTHEHIVPIYAVDEHGGLPYFAMEYVPGGTLQARLSHEGPLEVVAVVRIALQTAQALQAAHDSGLVHRDIKPANILLDRGVERVRVADFGLARTASEASFTASGVFAGTPQFMSPEQVRGEPCDGRSDLFSLGSVLYAMCTGREPFRAESIYGVLQRIVNDHPRPIREINPAVPPWLAQFVERLMAKECADRFASAAEVAAVLERELAYLQNPAIGPAPARSWMRRRTGGRGGATWRRRTVVALLATAALTTSAAVAWRLGHNAARDGVDSRETAAERSVDPQAPAEFARPTVPLWDADGASDALAFAAALAAAPYGAADSALPDPWPGEVAVLQQRLDALFQDLSPVETFRSEP